MNVIFGLGHRLVVPCPARQEQQSHQGGGQHHGQAEPGGDGDEEMYREGTVGPVESSQRRCDDDEGECRHGLHQPPVPFPRVSGGGGVVERRATWHRRQMAIRAGAGNG